MNYRLLISLFMVGTLVGCAGLGLKSRGSDGMAESGGSDLFDDEESASSSVGGKQAPMAEARHSRGLDRKYQALSKALRSGREDAVISEASKLLAVNGNDPVALNALAMFNFKRGRIGAARIMLERAFETNQNNPSLLNNFALLQIAEGDTNAALQTLKKAFQAADDNPEILGNLGSIYVQGGDYVKALPLLERAYRSAKGNASIAKNYAIALRAAKKYEKAEEIYEQLIKQNSKDVAVNLNYAILLIDYMGKPKEGQTFAIRVKFLESERKDVLDRANELEKKARSGVK